MELNYRFSYRGRDNGLDVRLFAGGMLKSNKVVPFYSLAPSGKSGRELWHQAVCDYFVERSRFIYRKSFTHFIRNGLESWRKRSFRVLCSAIGFQKHSIDVRIDEGSNSIHVQFRELWKVEVQFGFVGDLADNPVI